MALRGIRVLECAGLAPLPFCGMLLSDLGASVIRVDRLPGSSFNIDVLGQGKRSISLNLKTFEGVQIFRSLSKISDVLIEPFRPGKMEALGLGPEILLKDNPSLIYSRLTGFGQKGSYKNMAGHDINYLAMSGILSKLGRTNENPLAPLNLLSDFAGGSLMCVMGILAALFERTVSNQGQVIDLSMTEGTAYLGSWIFASQELFIWGQKRGCNFLDSGYHFYETYETKDGKYVAVGAIESHFYSELLKGLNLDENEIPQFGGNVTNKKEKFKQIFLLKTREEWMSIFDGTNGCVTPVLELEEAPFHSHTKDSFIERNGKFSPYPVPRLSRTPSIPSNRNGPDIGENTREILSNSLDFDDEHIQKLINEKIIYCHET